MAKVYKIQIDDGKGTDIQPVRIEQGVGDKGRPIRLVAQKSARYELQQERKDGANFAPDQLRVQRKGKNLQIWFDGSKQPDVVIEGYYDDASAMPTLMGMAENGNPYEYVPQDPHVNSLPAQLKDGDTLVAVALGGTELPGGFALAAAPLVAAAGGVSGWAIAGGAVAAGAAAGGGGGGGGTSPTPTPTPTPDTNGGSGGGSVPSVIPKGQTGALGNGVTNDTGMSQTDGVTKNANPKFVGVAEKGAEVEVTVNGVAYKTIASKVDGSYSIDLTNNGQPLTDGVYNPIIKVTNSVGSSTADGSPFTVDTSGATNQPGAVEDPNAATTLAISSISEDTGLSATDFITADNTLVVSGTVGSFTNAAGDRLLVQFLDASGKVLQEQAVTPNAGVWSMSTPSSALPVGTYTIKAVIVDLAGNEVKTATKPASIVAAAVTAVPDVADISEDVAEVAGDLIQGAGADSATHVGYAALHIEKVKAGAGNYVAVNGTQAVVTGTYGTLTVQDNGTYTYALSNNNATVQALQKAQVVADVFTYTLTDRTGHTSETTLNVNITGKNDLPTFLDNGQQLTTNVSRPPITALGETKISGVLTVHDADSNESGLFGGMPLKFDEAWQVGSFAIAEVTPAGGNFNWTYDKVKDWVNTDAIRHDLFTVKSIDGTASQTFDFEVTSVAGVTKQEFHTQSTDGIKVVGDSSYKDALVLHGASSFDLSLANVSLISVERIDISDTAAQSVKLRLENLLNADTTTIGSTAVHRMYVDGTSTDSVIFVGASLSASSDTAHQVAGYTVYQIDNTHDLLVSTAITNAVTFSNS